MKKILSTLICGLFLVTTASADLARAEMGIGAWMQTPTGDIAYKTIGTDSSNEASTTEIYAWALVKHPVPMLPNLRLEYVTTTNEGTATGTIGGFTFPVSSSTELAMTQIDIVPYYNLLDNTAWVTLDVGLDIKLLSIEYTTGGIDLVSTLPTDISLVAVPLGYVRARVQAPGTNIGIETDIKYLSYDTTTVSDIRIKVDYTFDMVPVIQPAIEIGYRIQKFEIEESGLAIANDYSGVYFGLMTRF